MTQESFKLLSIRIIGLLEELDALIPEEVKAQRAYHKHTRPAIDILIQDIEDELLRL